MRNRLESEDLFRLADALGLPLKRTRGTANSLSGQGFIKFHVFKGLDLTASATVVHSGVYEEEGFAGVAVSLMGSLMMVVLVNASATTEATYMQLWLVDKSKTKFAGKDFTPFPKHWSMPELCRNLLPGFVVGYGRKVNYKLGWVPQPEIIEGMEALAAQFPEGENSDGSVIEWDQVSRKYRTVGPRGV